MILQDREGNQQNTGRSKEKISPTSSITIIETAKKKNAHASRNPESTDGISVIFNDPLSYAKPMKSTDSSIGAALIKEIQKSKTSIDALHNGFEEANSKEPEPLPFPILLSWNPLPSSIAFATLSSTLGETFRASLGA